MDRYVFFLWNSSEPAASETAAHLVQIFRRCNPTWTSALTSEGASALLAPDGARSFESFPLPRRAGIVLGTLFPVDLARWSPGWTPVFCDRFAEAALLSAGRHLVETFWGRYVALLTAREGREHYVIRDCSGQIPCFALLHRGVHVLFAEIEDIACLPLPPFNIDRRALARFIFSAELPQRESGLREVRELLAGDCLAIKENSMRQFSLWNPVTICRAHPRENPVEAQTALRSVVQTCVSCWASRYHRILHKLSGGLDSAIVLGCLQRSPVRPAVTCINTHSVGIEADERAYARLAAAQADVELIELPLYPSGAALDGRLFDLPRSPRPSVISIFDMPALPRQNAVARRLAAEATWTGHGGDHLFLQSSLDLGAVDYVLDHGPISNFWPAVRDAARHSRMPYWQVLKDVARHGWFRTEWRIPTSNAPAPAFLCPELWRSIVDDVRPHRASAAAGLSVGKQRHIAIVAEVLNRHRPIPGLYAAQHHPLLSQPLIELCLQIPTYTLLRGGRDRSLARTAFADCVPPEIVSRSAKGTIASSLMRLVRDSAEFVKELIMEGELIRERIVERDALEPYVARGRPVDQWSLWPLLSCIAAEIWLRKWTTAGFRLNATPPPPHAAARC